METETYFLIYGIIGVIVCIGVLCFDIWKQIDVGAEEVREVKLQGEDFGFAGLVGLFWIAVLVLVILMVFVSLLIGAVVKLKFFLYKPSPKNSQGGVEE